jgi:hypothetical protein
MPKNEGNSKKLGRDEKIDPEELVRRYAAMKRFLEDNWGRLGLKLPRVSTPEKVKSVLNRVRDAKWSPAFRDFPTGCLLVDGSAKVTWREVRQTREKHKAAKDIEGILSLESHHASQAAQNARTAFDAAIAEYKQGPNPKESQRRLQRIAAQLRVEELGNQAQGLRARLQAAHQAREALETLLASQEAWLARNEVVSFVRDPGRRYSKTPANFAKAMAGLPFYDWLYSLRKCLNIPKVATVPKTYWFQVFEMLQQITKRTRSANLKKIELKLKNELLKPDTDSLLKSHISPHWFYMTLAFADCRGKKIRRAEIPYKVMEKFMDHFEGPSIAEVELSKHNQLLSTPLG